MKPRHAALLIAGLSACLSGSLPLRAEDSVTITFTGSGGVLQEAETKYYFAPFMKAHPNIKIEQDSPINYAKLQAMVEAENVTWDLAEGGPGFGLSPQHTKLLEKIDCNIVPCSHLQPAKYPTSGYRIAENTSATVLSYRTDKFPAGKEPQSWVDFFDVQKYPGGRTVLKIPGNVSSTGILEAALLADGVEPAKLYPLDLPRAMKKMESIRSSIVWAADNQACAEKVATGEAVMGICYNGRMYNFFKSGAPVAVQWNAAMHQGGYLYIPKGTKHLKEAMELAAYMVSDEHAAAITPEIPYGPANSIAAKNSDPATAAWNPAAHQDQGVAINDLWWAEHSAEAIRLWTEWQLKG
jgi:putative spermidine/putrescine transport system substrate-binding protein